MGSVMSVMIGIDDQLYFSRLFKKCMGISPSEYAKLVILYNGMEEEIVLNAGSSYQKTLI